MKRSFTAAAICLLAGVALILFFGTKKNAENPMVTSSSEVRGSNPATPANQPQSASTPSASQKIEPAVAPGAAISNPFKPQDLSARAGERLPDTNADEVLSPERALENVGRAVHQYGDMFDGNPVGTNPEITAALMGKNPKQINFLSGQPGMRVNQNGELIDSWGTPYFFHQISGTEMEIHSAGPDKIMWTSDDLATR